ncbi:MAG TPA: glycoside hydrolase family 2 TIM barrel-domain containing protein, partial [Actinomycetota bacterium]|nr:glycoside hydrolase family 2 TIM barrel-domain containing protein [Actinomycetota bacterium]
MLARDRPSARQRVASLDGAWTFWPDLADRLPTGPGAPFVPVDEREGALGDARSAIVPSPWQALFEDLRSWAGSAWYEKRFDVDESWRDRDVRLCFGAIDYFCSVWVNGREVGEHEGGYLPFALDVTDAVRSGGANTVTVRVLDVGPGQDDGPFPFAEIPHGKQSWYGPIGGIWQRAWVEARGADLIEGARVHADPASGGIRVVFRGPDAVRYRVLDPDGRNVASGAADAPTFETSVAGAIPWYPARPALYELELETSDDRWSTTFGFRTVGTHEGIVTVNGDPVYLLGALDQDYWPGSIATPPSEEALEREMRLARELGLNLLRCHIKPPAPSYLYAADRAGILVWCEPPSWISLTAEAGRRARTTIAGMVERDANHPSLVAWSIVNEGWGVDLAGSAEDRAWLADTFDWAKALDPTRLWVDNSACPPTVHARSDLNDFHLYRAVPEQLPSWRRWTTGWARDAGRTYPAADGSRTDDEPRVLSEFGIWGLPDVDAFADGTGDDPWWFDTGGDTTDAIVRPKSVRDRFDDWALGEIFGSWGAFVRQSQEHQFEGLKAEIEDLRLHPEIAGYVITELTDVHWEANGLLDLRRNRKAFHERFEQVNAQTVLIGRPEHTRYRSGERAVIHVTVASPRSVPDTRVAWKVANLGLGGTIVVPGPITFDVPTIDSPVAVTVSLELLAPDASGIAR